MHLFLKYDQVEEELSDIEYKMRGIYWIPSSGRHSRHVSHSFDVSELHESRTTWHCILH